MALCIVSSVGLEDCAASALIGHNRVMLTALPRYRNLPHNCQMKCFPCASNGGAVDFVLAYCLVAPYFIGAHGYGEGCCFSFRV